MHPTLDKALCKQGFCCLFLTRVSEDVHVELDIGRRVEGGLGQSVPTSDTL